jgi:hypothetical protein
MYDTSSGLRVLQRAERQLFVAALGTLVDMLASDEFDTGVQVIGDLTRNQQIATYHAMARALLDPKEMPPPLTAILEGAVASVYQQIQNMIAWELDDADDDDEDSGGGGLNERPTWRETAATAGRELGIEDPPDPDDMDLDHWNLLVECLSDHVLWDKDWEMLDQLDADPDAAERAKDELGIDPDYFVAVPADPSDAQVEQLLADLVRWTRDAG